MPSVEVSDVSGMHARPDIEFEVPIIEVQGFVRPHMV
jgi:hypothetical protein